jgi:cytochrome c oxidase cbb3-type subunit III
MNLRETCLVVLALAALAAAAAARPRTPPRARAQATPPVQQPAPPPAPAPSAAAKTSVAPYGGPAKLLESPVSTLFPGDTTPAPPLTNPVAGDPEASQRGMGYFNMFNCSGCHAPNGGGGMGPSLSDRFFIYGDEPQNIYLSIYQGRPNGMPSWGAMLSESIIWDLVAYVRGISRAPTSGWGQTFSRDAFQVEQIPGEFAQTTTPWSQTERFGFGQKPNEAH